jgi:long-chain acyl-CoA synthetase
VQPGDRVAVMLPNCPEVTIAYAATWRAGAAAMPVVFLMGPSELAHVLSDSGAVVAVTSPEFLATMLGAAGGSSLRAVVVVGGVPEGVSAPEGIRLVDAGELDAAEPLAIVPRGHRDLAALLYTGGTTGRAKGVMLCHEGLSAAGWGGAEVSFVPGCTRTLLPLPLSHAYGLLVSVISLHTHEPSEALLLRWFDPTAFIRVTEELRPHRCAVVPSMLALLLASPLEQHDFSSMRFVTSGGAPLPLEVAKAFESRVPGITICEGYGMTETTALCCSNPPLARKLGTVGRPAPGYTVHIEAPDGTELGVGEEGEITVESAAVMLGYWNDGAATAEAVRDGRLHTGDIGVRDEEGYIRIVDRLKDLIIRGGFNVYPRDVEDALTAHPAVLMAAVVGKPHPTHGEEVVAFVSLRPDADPKPSGEELVAWSRERMAKHKYPREVHVIDAVPLTSVGKTDRKALRARL